MSRICVFDVNETLLDLAALDAPFESAFGQPGVRRKWFSQLVQSALVTTVTDAYVDFGTWESQHRAEDRIAVGRGESHAATFRDRVECGPTDYG